MRLKIINKILIKKGVIQMSNNLYNEESIKSLSPLEFTRLRPRRLLRVYGVCNPAINRESI